MRWHREKLVPSCAPDRRLTSRIHAGLKTEQDKNPINKWANETNGPQMMNYIWPINMWKTIVSSVIRDLQVKATLRFHYSSQKAHNKCWRRYPWSRAIYPVGGMPTNPSSVKISVDKQSQHRTQLHLSWVDVSSQPTTKTIAHECLLQMTHNT